MAREGTEGRQMAVKDTTTKDPHAKAAAVLLLSRGLITKSEAAELAGVSRQLIQHWTRGIPVDQNRSAMIAKLWRKSISKFAQ